MVNNQPNEVFMLEECVGVRRIPDNPKKRIETRICDFPRFKETPRHFLANTASDSGKIKN